MAAEAIADNLSASELDPKLRQVIKGLHSHSVKIVSYACTGATVEQAIQDMFISKAKATLSIKVPDPEEKEYMIQIPLFGPTNSPVIMIQDSKHTLKTFQNNLFSEARLLVLGKYSATYSKVWEIAFSDQPNSPLYCCNVKKMDWQDDNTATHLFSTATLDFVGKNHPNHIGLAVYLFVTGQTINAYQSHTICHLKQLKMVLWCWYFLQLWKQFLKTANYTQRKYYIFREADNILKKLIAGLLSLIYVYCDNLCRTYPLLLWMHCTEIVEHVFAECWKLVKDFTHHNLIFMTICLHISVCLGSELSHGIDPRAHACSYSHAYLDPKAACLKSIAVFLSDHEIKVTSGQAVRIIPDILNHHTLFHFNSHCITTPWPEHIIKLFIMPHHSPMSIFPMKDMWYLSRIRLLTSKISHICQEICDIRDARKAKSNLLWGTSTSTLLNEAQTNQTSTREPNSSSSAKEGSDDEGGWDETCSSHSKLCHHEPNNLSNSSHYAPSLPSPSPTPSGSTPSPPATPPPSPISRIGTSTPSSPS